MKTILDWIRGQYYKLVILRCWWSNSWMGQFYYIDHSCKSIKCYWCLGEPRLRAAIVDLLRRVSDKFGKTRDACPNVRKGWCRQDKSLATKWIIICSIGPWCKRTQIVFCSTKVLLCWVWQMSVIWKKLKTLFLCNLNSWLGCVSTFFSLSLAQWWSNLL